MNTNSFSFHLNLLQGVTKMLTKRSLNYMLPYIFLRYALLKLKAAINAKYSWNILSDEALQSLAKQSYNKDNCYVDINSCLVGNLKDFQTTEPIWCYICSLVSSKKYKVQIVLSDRLDSNEIFVSETVKHNVENVIQNSINKSFLIKLKNDCVVCAKEAKISMIANPYECTENLIGIVLENYFLVPRFLRKNDVFAVKIKEHIMDQIYLHTNVLMCTIYFKVKDITLNQRKQSVSGSGSYILRGETALILEADIHSYLPPKCINYNRTKEDNVTSYPSSLNEPLERLEDCILPFIKYDIYLPVKPMFLIKGTQGSNKRMLVQAVAEKMGLNLLNADFAEVQALTSAQTEAKLRIVLHNAEQSMPCILCLNNIEVFGKNSEGQKDERIISAFCNEINCLFDKRLEYPIIIVATTSETEISAELNRIFVETIHLGHLDQNGRTDLISWLLAQRNLEHDANLTKISGICSDFAYSDLLDLILHAVKFQCKDNLTPETPFKLSQEDFDEAYDYMQSIYTNCKDAPRVPKVYWEDIGGLANLKHEIIRRIQLPLMNALGFGQSGLLLYGPPGTGKTLLAKAVATEYQFHFLSVKGPEVLNMYVGQSEKNVRQIFERARAAAPCIIFFDELDSLAPNRGRSGDSGGVMDRIVSQLLAEMDGLNSSTNIFIIGATNRPDLIDPALLRPGRFDKLLYVGIHSDRDSQLNVLKALTRKFKFCQGGRELEEFIDRLPDHTTGADLYAVCSNAWLNAARRILCQFDKDLKDIKLNEPVVVGIEDFVKAVQDLVPSVSKEEAERYKRMQTELSSVI